MKYNCEILGSGKDDKSPFSKKTPNASLPQKILIEIEGQKLIALDGEISLLNQDATPVWEKSFKIEGRPNRAFISKDRLLITSLTMDYHAWGVLGPAYLIDLNNGALVAELKGASGAALEGGRFILGLEGYGCFNTWLYDRDGSLVQEWPSYGHYVVGENDDIRVLEKDRTSPTQSRIVRLHFNGQIEKGPRLNEGLVSEPLILKDNSIILIDKGMLRIVDADLNQQYQKVLLEVPETDSSRFHSKIEFTKEGLISINIYEKSKEAPIKYKNNYWLISLKY